jgi:integral membrane sensor domain MASE1
MKKCRKFVAMLTVLSLLSTTSAAFAAEDVLKETFTSAFYGGAIGALLGGACMVFQKKPADHWNYLAYGAATGVIAGTAFGLAKSARAFAEVENGRVKMAFPTIVPELVTSPDSHQTTVAWKTNLIQGSFN